MEQDRVEAVRQRVSMTDRKRRRAELELVKVEMAAVRHQLYKLVERLQAATGRVQALDREMVQEETTVRLPRLT